MSHAVGLEAIRSHEMAGTVYNDKDGQAKAMLELAQRAVEDDCTDAERHKLQGQLITLRERIDETVDAYDKLGEYRDALYAAWKASNDIVNQLKS